MSEGKQELEAMRTALERITEAAKSWHEFHHGSDIVQCDEICACLPECEAALESNPVQPTAPPEDCQWMSYARGGMGWCACGKLGSEKEMVPYVAWEQHMQGNPQNPGVSK